MIKTLSSLIFLYVSLELINAQCDSNFVFYEEFPSTINHISGDSCFSINDIITLDSLISQNDLIYDSPLKLGSQTWFNGRLKILVAGNYGNSSGVNDTIYYLPNNIGNLSVLSSLYLEWNSIDSLPSSFSNLIELKSLYISNNQLQNIDNIYSLPSLNILDLGYNNILSISDSICELNELNYLWLFNNKLESMPDCMCAMTLDWSGDDSGFFPYFAIGGNNLCENIPSCIENSNHFQTSLDQFYYSFQITTDQICDSLHINNNVFTPSKFSVSSPYPNPFNSTTYFSIYLEINDYVNISVYDLNGREIDLLFNGERSKGVSEFSWDARNFSSGIYLLRVNNSKGYTFKKIVFNK
tara:strand:- start:821 stop:1882 length:1062 start_codon:yes stop_codon:yes gene_type:complete